MHSEKAEDEIKDEVHPGTDFDPYVENDDRRASIDTAIQVIQFLEGVDPEGALVLGWNLKRQTRRVQKICYKAILELTENLLATEEEKSEEDDD